MGIWRKKVGSQIPYYERIEKADLRWRKTDALYGDPEGEVYRLAALLKKHGDAKDVWEGGRTYWFICSRRSTRGIRFLDNLAVEMYGKCGSVAEARKVFDSLEYPNEFSYNLMMRAYAENGHLEEARKLFISMPDPSVVSWTAMVTAYGQHGCVKEAKETFDWMPERNDLPWTALLEAYAQNGYLDEAKSILNTMPEPSVVTRNAMIAAYGQSGHLEEAKSMFDSMTKRNVLSWCSMFQAYAQQGHFEDGKKLTGMLKRNTVTYTMLVAVYGQSGLIDEARSTFESMPDRTVVSWNAMVAAYAHTGHLVEAKKMFDSMPVRDGSSWNTMIEAYVLNGRARDALWFFHVMNRDGMKPNHVGFTSIFTACTHLCLLDEGWQYFLSMVADHGMIPSREHYCYMVDLLGRSGRLKDAEELINHMPFLPHHRPWRSLLAASRIYRHPERAARAAERLFELDPKDAAPYVMLANIYSTLGRLEDVAAVRKLMIERNVVKEPGFSSIEVDNKVHKFMAEDISHPRYHDILSELQKLSSLLRDEAEYVPEMNAVLHNATEDEKEKLLCHHSEKLAIAYGLIGTAPDAPIKVVKNLRACSDCHAFTKLISKLVGRVIVLRDANRFHRFQNGRCSCRDYW